MKATLFKKGNIAYMYSPENIQKGVITSVLDNGLVRFKSDTTMQAVTINECRLTTARDHKAYIKSMSKPKGS